MPLRDDKISLTQMLEYAQEANQLVSNLSRQEF